MSAAPAPAVPTPLGVFAALCSALGCHKPATAVPGELLPWCEWHRAAHRANPVARR